MLARFFSQSCKYWNCLSPSKPFHLRITGEKAERKTNCMKFTIWILNYEGRDFEVSPECARGNLGPDRYAELMFNGFYDFCYRWERRIA